MKEADLQQLVQRQVARFCERVSEALAPLEQSPRRNVSDAAIKEGLLYFSSAVDIATGPYPEVSLVDLLVFLRLCRRVLERHWIPNVYGAPGADVAAAFSKSEADLWSAAAPLIDESRKRELETLIEEWMADNPEQLRVEGVRLDDFWRGIGHGERGRAERAKGLLSSIQSATESANEMLLVAERGMFQVNRMPFLLRLQLRVALREVVSDVLVLLREVSIDVGNLVLRAPTRLLARVTAGASSVMRGVVGDRHG
jgi:hypothetical protein